uniref:Uncharacterized protein n=1 Tax=Anguilla anguilla TaxID=7936 RepID=A0A0E9UJM0_ANGAN
MVITFCIKGHAAFRPCERFAFSFRQATTYHKARPLTKKKYSTLSVQQVSLGSMYNLS